MANKAIFERNGNFSLYQNFAAFKMREKSGKVGMAQVEIFMACCIQQRIYGIGNGDGHKLLRGEDGIDKPLIFALIAVSGDGIAALNFVKADENINRFDS